MLEVERVFRKKEPGEACDQERQDEERFGEIRKKRNTPVEGLKEKHSGGGKGINQTRDQVTYFGTELRRIGTHRVR